jgi:hypothetical protein
VLSSESTALIVKLYVPIVVGVPEITPVPEFNDRPGGRLPMTESAYGLKPPLAKIVSE